MRPFETVPTLPPHPPVLIVEDNDDTREVLRTILELEGHPVVAVSNGLEALEQLTAGLVPCLIVLDLFMPVMNGREFRQQQLSLGLQSDVPVIVYSAAPSADVQDLNVAAVVAKPAGVEEILDAVNCRCSASRCRDRV